MELTRFADIDAGSFSLLPSVAYLNRDQLLAEGGRLRGLFRHNWAINQARLTAALPLLAALQEEGLDPVFIKGTALAEPVYGSLGARRMADIDVLVPAEQFSQAAALAVKVGFPPNPGFAWPRASAKSWAFVGPGRAEVDLHARPLQAAWDGAAEAAMRAHPGTLSVSGRAFKTLSASANLVVAIVHGLGYDARSSCQWILDVALLIQAGGVDWGEVAALARLQDVELAVARGLDTVRSLLPPGSVPRSTIVGRSSLRHRLEHVFRTQEPSGMLGALPNLYFAYLRERETGHWGADFASFLRDAWQVPPTSGLGPVLLKKSLRRLRSVLSTRRPLADPRG